jgi:hypothetical protein
MRRLFLVLVLLVAGCSADRKPEPQPAPSPDLTSAPAAVAVNPGPFRAGPVAPPATGAYLGAWIKPQALTHVGRLEAVDALQKELGRRLDIVNTY